MSKRNKKRFLDYWFIRIIEGCMVIGGWERHAGRWIMDRVIYQNATTHRGQQTYLFVCENNRYKVGRQASPEQWSI